ncbi:hypothetical protein BDV93DRAFT_601748 [Ceratobasidium sp. AG-I]|nr:hypothetical protein BDV93DRAFT_601748 [Ceratobasidium sp. AG-I]
MQQSSCTERAQYILEQAMRKGRYRWGIGAERVAGASICVALRESGRAETVREVAVHIQCNEEQLARTYRHLTSLLNIKLEPLDPGLLVPSMWNYTQTCLTTPPDVGPPFPPELVAFLNNLVSHTQTILNLALQLSNLILHVSLTQGRQQPVVACALLIVSLSGEAGKPVPKSNALTSTLSARFGGTARSVADRVREIERVIEDWRQELPWAQSNIPPNSRKRSTKIACWIKDVIAFKDNLWSKQIEAVEHARYSPSTDNCSEDEADDDASCTGSSSAAGSKRSVQTSSTSGGKRRNVDTGYYDSGRPRAYVVEPSKGRLESQTAATKALLHPDAIQSTHTPPVAFPLHTGLSSSRASIPDEELFRDGELESFMRSSPEVEALRARWEEEKRFEGVPEWADNADDAPSAFTEMNGVLNPHVVGEDMAELIGEWRGASPSRFDDGSYFYED